MGKTLSFAGRFVTIYGQKRLARASAALSYYITMTFFPCIICLYTMLGNSYDKAMDMMELAGQFMPMETVRVVENFLGYVARNHSPAMMVAGLTIVVTSASAAFRSIQATIGDMQGGTRFDGVRGFLYSLLFSLLFLGALYFAVIVMLTSNTLVQKLNEFLPFVDISQSWQWLRFVLLAAIFYIILWCIFEASKRDGDDYKTEPGALIATLAMVGVSVAFSVFISASARYPLVYGSLASLVLLMLWLYMSCIAIYCGAAVNIVLWKNEATQEERNK